MKDLQSSIRNIRRNALKMALDAGKGGSHVGGSFSCLEILAVLYGKILNYKLEDRKWNERDRFLASKAHCILTHYATLAEFGFLKEEDLNSFHEDGGLLAGHPFGLDIGMEFSGGSLGMGLSVGIGMAIMAKQRGESHRVYVLLGDGECNEGAVWEAFLSAPKFHLDNLVAIVDYNNMQFDGTNKEIMDISPMEEKLGAFGWQAVRCDGHDTESLEKAFLTEHFGKPLAIVANTVKARGIRKFENKPESHHCVITQEDYEMALADMENNRDDRNQ